MLVNITQKDILRMLGQKAENTSLASAYFKDRPLHPSTHIKASFIKKEVGNIPVVGRGGPGVRPKHGMESMLIEPMPIEIDDTLSAVEMDDYERADDMGKQQIVDEYTSQHFDMARETMNALCCQAHRGHINYMMSTPAGLLRYDVNYGTPPSIEFGRVLSKVKLAQVQEDLTKMKSKVRANGIGGPGEFIAAGDVYSILVELLTTAHKEALIGENYVMIGPDKVYQDNDSYIDISSTGVKTVKSLCESGEICFRALNAGQKMPFLRLDDSVQRSTVAFYSFTKEREDQRGTNIYSKTKPFPMVNTKGICWGKYVIASYAVNFTAGANGTLSAAVDGEAIVTGDAVSNGKIVVFTVTPGAGYELDAFAGTNAAELVSNDDGTYSLAVDAVKTISVTFKATT